MGIQINNNQVCVLQEDHFGKAKICFEDINHNNQLDDSDKASIESEVVNKQANAKEGLKTLAKVLYPANNKVYSANQVLRSLVSGAFKAQKGLSPAYDNQAAYAEYQKAKLENVDTDYTVGMINHVAALSYFTRAKDCAKVGDYEGYKNIKAEFNQAFGLDTPNDHGQYNDYRFRMDDIGRECYTKKLEKDVRVLAATPGTTWPQVLNLYKHLRSYRGDEAGTQRYNEVGEIRAIWYQANGKKVIGS